MEKLVIKYNNFIDKRSDRRELYKSLLALVIPIGVQNLLGALVNSADILMLGYVGQNELFAVLSVYIAFG